MPVWEALINIVNFAAAYYTTLLVRCAVFSFVLIWIVMLFRQIFRNQTFLKNLSWTWFLMIPFLGRLRLFYENEAVLKATWRLTKATVSQLWLDRIYIAGILTSAVCIFGKRLCFQRRIRKMRTVLLENRRICITDMQITPFTTGLLKPKIVIPEAMIDSYSTEEIRIIIHHEQTHIRLGHLWFGFAWDILRCLLWVNPFLTFFQRYFKADLEDICDKVCIQTNGISAQEYGLVLLKSLKLLRSGQKHLPITTTYAGENGFADIKRRMEKIAAFRPYHHLLVQGMCAIGLILLMAAGFAVQANSYGHSNENSHILIGKCDGSNEVISSDTAILRRMISYNNQFVYVKRDAFEQFLEEHDADGDICITFDGFYKLPGFGGAGELCFYERTSTQPIVKIPYESIHNIWYYRLLKAL